MSDGRTRLLETAERLYAERGLDGVSLREITEAAGQRNNAAVHYHFGGRDGLVRALFELRFAALDQRRADLLAGLGDDPSLEDLVRVLVVPFAEAAGDDEGHWVRFVARLHEDSRFNPFAGELPYGASEDVTVATREVSARIRQHLAVDPDEAVLRMYLVTTLAVHAVADHQAMGAAARIPGGERFTLAVVAAALAILTAS